jgi:undecaprenyl phosphate N,N'-diacetylbacillosamine 1-phosphate transferase
VNGRNSIHWDERLTYDVSYVDNWSIRLDLKIALMTIPVWLKAQGINTPGYATYARLDEERPSVKGDPSQSQSQSALTDG